MAVIFAAFGVNVGNLGGTSPRRVPMPQWASGISDRLGTRRPGSRIVRWFGHTGNLALESTYGGRDELGLDLAAAAGTRFAVISLEDLPVIVRRVEEQSTPPKVPGNRWTRGVAFAVDGPDAVRRDLQNTSRAHFYDLGPWAVGVWKLDAETGAKIPDRANRRGGWRAIAHDVAKQLSGTWTARSLRTVKGLLDQIDHPRTPVSGA